MPAAPPIQAPQALRLRHEGVEADRISAYARSAGLRRRWYIYKSEASSPPPKGAITRLRRTQGVMKVLIFVGIGKGGHRGQSPQRSATPTQPRPLQGAVLPGGFNFGTLSGISKSRLRDERRDNTEFIFS